MLRVQTITGHLLLLALGLATPILLLSAFIGRAYIVQERERIESTAERQASQVVSQIDNQLAAFRATLKVLVTGPDALGGDLEALRARLEAVEVAPGTWFTLRDRSGRQLLNTSVPRGQPLPTFAGRGDPVIFELGQGFTSNLIWAPVTEQWAVTLSVPVRPKPEDPVEYALTIGIPASLMHRLIADVPQGWIVAINDRDGRIIARSLGHEQWVGKAMAAQGWELTKDVPPGRGGLWRDIHNLEGIPIVGAYHRMESTGWLVGISALPEVYEAPRRNTLQLGALLVAIALLAATTLAFLIGRRITEAIQALQAKAVAMREMRIVNAPPTSLAEVNAVSDIMRETIRTLHARQEQQATMLQELNHRVKNTLATILSISRMTLRNSPDMHAFDQAFTARILALSKTHNLLTESSWSGVELHELVATELQPFDTSARVILDGPAVTLSSKIAVALGMAIHELATNAAKYGPGRGESGHIEVRWEVVDETLILHWVERSSHVVRSPSRKGFGTRLIQQTIERELEGRAELRYPPEGFSATFTVPLNVSDRMAA
jgi:two-component sensor histidine kinase